MPQLSYSSAQIANLLAKAGVSASETQLETVRLQLIAMIQTAGNGMSVYDKDGALYPFTLQETSNGHFRMVIDDGS